MNILSKILIIAFIIISVNSIGAQDHVDYVSTDGIVTVEHKGYEEGTGFFISPHALITNFHVIDSIRKSHGSISEHLFIIHPETKKRISVHSIQAIDAGNDLAVLHVKDYESPVYYELFEESEETLSSLEAYMFDRRRRSFSLLEGVLSFHYASQTIKTFSLPFKELHLAGLSGSPVFSKDGKVIGVTTEKVSESLKTLAFLSSSKAVKELLLSSFFNCESIKCVKEEMLLPESDVIQSDELKTHRAGDIMYLAEQGSMYDQFKVGVMYANGKWVEQDEEEAVKWYRLSAEQGHARAQDSLGWMYLTGQGVEQDGEEAVKWIRRAAEQGYARAQDHLGWMYAKGRGVAEDEEEAVRLYRLAAEQGYAEAQNHLGWMYANGEGVEQDDEKAVEWYTLAAKQGEVSAQNNLGWMYANGKGVAEDQEEAVEWFRKAAKQGQVNAQYNLGWMYDNGRGVEQDVEEAVKWYTLAAEQGHEKAQKALDRIGNMIKDKLEYINIL